MSIIAFVGLPGSGKSYGVVENVILKAFSDRRHVVTNIPLNKGAIYTDYPDAEYTPISNIQDLEDGHGFNELPKGAVVVLDEVWRIWPSGMKADKIPLGAKEFLAEHRHQVGPDGRTTEIVLVVQDLAQVAAFAVRLVEKTYISRKHTELGMTSRYVVGIFSGAVKGLQGPAARELGVIQGRYSADVWKFYKSHTQAQDGVVGNEQASDTRGIAWKRPLVMVGLPAAVIALAFGIYGVLDFLAPSKVDKQAVAQKVEQREGVTRHEQIPGLVQRAAAVHPDPVPLPSPFKLPYSGSWRLAAVIEYADGSGIAMAVSGKKQRRIPMSDCERNNVAEWECLLSGERVATWTGTGPGDTLADTLIGKQARNLQRD